VLAKPGALYRTYALKKYLDRLIVAAIASSIRGRCLDRKQLGVLISRPLNVLYRLDKCVLCQKRVFAPGTYDSMGCTWEVTPAPAAP
jgi:hypothetical protein